MTTDTLKKELLDLVNNEDTKKKALEESCQDIIEVKEKYKSMTTKNIKEKPLDRLYKLYEECRKNGDPQSYIDYYIDYFKVRKLLLDEIDLAIAERENQFKEEMIDYGFDEEDVEHFIKGITNNN